MASDSGRNTDPSRSTPPTTTSTTQQSHDDATNPFTKFSHFVDAQITSFLHGVIGLPSSMTRQNGNHGWADPPTTTMRRAEDGNNVDGSGSGNETSNGVEGGNNNPLRRWEEWANSNAGASVLDILSTDPERLWGELGKLQNELAESFGWAMPRQFQWLSPDNSILSYILFSSYSPLMLPIYNPELRYMTIRRGNERMSFPLTEAFEDLLRASQDQPIAPLPTPQLFTYHPNAHPWVYNLEDGAKQGMDWIRHLYDDGLLGRELKKDENTPQWPRKWQIPPASSETNTKAIEGSTDAKSVDPETEQDTYDWLEGNPSARNREKQTPSILDHMMQRDHSSRDDFFKKGFEGFFDGKVNSKFNGSMGFESSSSTTSSTRDENGSMISTTKTTERHMLEDGSIRTKTVIHKRFADGRESSTETTHVERPHLQQQQQQQQKQLPDPNTATVVAQKDNEKKTQDNKDKGWFWN